MTFSRRQEINRELNRYYQERVLYWGRIDYWNRHDLAANDIYNKLKEDKIKQVGGTE